MMHLSEAQFEAFRKEAIAKLAMLRFKDDPHVILVTGDHDHMEVLGVSCDAFKVATPEKLLEQTGTHPLALFITRNESRQ